MRCAGFLPAIAGNSASSNVQVTDVLIRSHRQAQAKAD
jgi:hypothetical protein